MIPRTHRFHGLNSLNHVYKHGRTVRGSFITLKFVAGNPDKTWRCAVVVSKKVSKSAVVRNRIRRRIYEVIREHGAEITRPYDLVVSVFDEKIALVPPSQLSKALDTLLSQAGIIS